MPHQNRPEHESMLSIPREWRPAYFIVFLIQMIGWLSITIYIDAGNPAYPSWQHNAVGIMHKMAPLTQESIIYTILILEIVRYLMLLAPYFEAKIIAKAKAEAHKEWVAWFARKQAAEAKGEPFHEPSPAERDASNNNNGT